MQMQVTAHPGMNVQIAVITDLFGDSWSGDWDEPWRTVVQTNRTTTVIDLDAGQHPHRFYKAKVP